MIAYFDTSAIVPLLIDEPGTSRSREVWVAAERLVSVRLARVEASAALAQAMRSGRISRPQHRSSAAALDPLLDQLELVDVDDDLVRRAADVAESRSLRAYDAVHLAAALTVASEDLVFVAGDRPLLGAAEASGINAVRTA